MKNVFLPKFDTTADCLCVRASYKDMCAFNSIHFSFTAMIQNGQRLKLDRPKIKERNPCFGLSPLQGKFKRKKKIKIYQEGGERE